MGASEKSVAPYGPNTTEAGLDGSQETLVVKPLKSWKGYLWDTFELPPDQRWLLFKLDAFVLTFASVCIKFTICFQKGPYSVVGGGVLLFYSSGAPLDMRFLRGSFADWLFSQEPRLE